MEPNKESNKFWEKFIVEREAILSKLDKQELFNFEKDFNNDLNNKLNARKALGYFNWKLLLTDKIQFYIVISNRNNGKSWATRDEMETVVSRGKEFLLIRTMKTELDATMPTFKKWFDKKGWKFKKGDGRIFDNQNKTVGWVRCLSQAYANKSAEFENVELIVYEEFISDKTIKNQFDKFITYTITAQRQKKNFKVFLLANFIDGENNILNNLGFSVIDTGGISFNWLTGAMLWLVPSGTFNEFKESENIGYRASLTSKTLYSKNYGGGFTNTSLKNIQNQNYFSKNLITPILIICENNFMCLLKIRNDTGKYFFDVIIGDEINDYNCLKITTNYNLVLRSENLQYVKEDYFVNIINMWYNNSIKTNGDIELRNKLNKFFTTILNKNEKKELVYELSN